MRKPAFCICENKGADQLRAADQRLYFRYIAEIQNFKPQTIFCGCTARFVLDLNPEDRFSRVAAHYEFLYMYNNDGNIDNLFGSTI